MRLGGRNREGAPPDYLPGMAYWDAAATHRLVGPGRFVRALPRSTEIVGFAPSAGVCKSRAGRLRAEHELDRDGRCYWCS